MESINVYWWNVLLLEIFEIFWCIAREILTMKKKYSELMNKSLSNEVMKVFFIRGIFIFFLREVWIKYGNIRLEGEMRKGREREVVRTNFLRGNVYELRSLDVITMNINAGKFEQNRNIDVSLSVGQLRPDLNWTNAGPRLEEYKLSSPRGGEYGECFSIFCIPEFHWKPSWIDLWPWL